MPGVPTRQNIMEGGAHGSPPRATKTALLTQAPQVSAPTCNRQKSTLFIFPLEGKRGPRKRAGSRRGETKIMTSWRPDGPGRRMPNTCALLFGENQNLQKPKKRGRRITELRLPQADGRMIKVGTQRKHTFEEERSEGPRSA